MILFHVNRLNMDHRAEVANKLLTLLGIPAEILFKRHPRDRAAAVSWEWSLDQSCYTHNLPIAESPVGLRNLKVWLAPCFAFADDDTIVNVALMITHRDAQAIRTVDSFAQKYRRKIAIRRRRPFVTKGLHHDLKEIFERVCKEYYRDLWFKNRCVVGWSSPLRRNCRPRFLGRCTSRVSEKHRIEISPLLDQPMVPPLVLERVMFHELLHAFYNEQQLESARHNATFQESERTFPKYHEAKAWEQENLVRCLSSYWETCSARVRRRE